MSSFPPGQGEIVIRGKVVAKAFQWGSVNEEPLLNYLDDWRHDWQAEVEPKERAAHVRLCFRLGLVPPPRERQRVQAEGTLAGLWGAVL